ncbi:MAG: hypothetical protein M3N91_08740 [Pseudomonadota bacterium]|nr:hypothetical protein [Pseudomonadota bacterium]
MEAVTQNRDALTRHTAHSTRQPVSAALVAHEMQTTRPLAIVMAEKVAALRAWAGGRTVSAD